MNLESQQIQEQIRASVALAAQQKQQQAAADAYIQSSVNKQMLEKTNQRELLRLQQKGMDMISMLEGKTQQYSSEHSAAFAKMRSDLQGYINAQMGVVDTKGGMNAAKSGLRQQLEEIKQDGAIRLNTSRQMQAASQQEEEAARKAGEERSRQMEQQDAARQRELQAIEAAVAREQASEKRREQAAIERYKTAQQAAEQRKAAQENLTNQQEAARQRELQSIQNAVARETAAEKQREQASINRYKTAQQAGEQRRLAQESDEKLNARSVTQQNSLWNAVEKADAALEKQAQTLRNLKNTGAADEIERLRSKLQEVASMDLAKIGGKGTLLPTQNVDTFLADNRLTIQGYDDEIKKLSEVSKTSAESHAERIRQAEKLNATEAQIRATRYSDNAQFQSVVKAQEVETAAFLTNLRARSVGMTKAQVESEISEHQRLAAAKVSLAAEGAQAEVNAQFARATQMNKAAMAVYSVQQAVEDFSYAGMKGAMNNLSFLAMMIGGTGGLVALFGAMALNVGITSGAFDKWADSLEIAGRKTKEQEESVKRLVETMMLLKDLQFDNSKDKAHFNPVEADLNKLSEQQVAKENDIRLEKERAAAANGSVIAYQEMQKIAKSLGSYADMGWSDFGVYNENVQSILENIDLIRQEGQKVITAHYGLMSTPEKTEALRWFDEQLNKMEELDKEFQKFSKMASTDAGFEAMSKAAAESNKELMKLESSLRGITDQLQLTEKTGLTFQGLKDLENYKFSAKGESVSGFAGKNLSTAVSDQNAWYDKRRVELAHELAISIEKAAGSEEKKLAAIEQYLYYLNLEKAWGIEAVNNAEANAAAHEKTTKAIEARETAIKKEIADSERLLEISEKNLQNIQEQKSAWQDTEAKRKAAALDRIDDLKHEENKDSINKDLKTKLEQAKDYKQYLDAVSKHNLDQMKLANAHGKGDANPDHILQQQYDKWKYYNDQEYEEFVKKEKAKAQARIDASEKSTHAEKQKRLDQLKEDLGGKAQDTAARAAQLQAEGKWEQAKSELEKSMKALKELHEAQQKAIGKTTSDQSKKAEQEMEATSKKIEKLFDDMAKLEDQQQQKIKKDIDNQKVALKEIIDLKAQAATINMTNPADIARLAAIEAALARILALMQQIQGTQLVGTSRVAGGPISPNQPPLVTPPAAPPAAPPPVPANQLPPGGGGLPSIPYDGRELPPLPPSTPEQRAMEEQERATAEHWAKQKEMRDKAALDERVAAAEEQRMAKANQNARKQQQDEEIAARHKFMDELDRATPAEKLKSLQEEEAAAWKNYLKPNSTDSGEWGDAYRAVEKEQELQRLAKKSLKEKRELNNEDMKFAEEIRKQDQLARQELLDKGWDADYDPEAGSFSEEFSSPERQAQNKRTRERRDELNKEREHRQKLDDARRKAGLPREDWKKQDYEEAVKAEQRVQNIQKQTQAEQAGIDALSQAKEKAEAKAKARAEAKAAEEKKAAEATAKQAVEGLSYQEILDKRDKRRNPGLTPTEDAALAAKQNEIDQLERERVRKEDKEWEDRQKAHSEKIAKENPNGLTAEMLAKEKQHEQDLLDSQREREEYQKKIAEEKAGIGKVTQAKQGAEAINLVDPNEISTVQGVNSQLERTLALVQSIAAASSIGSGMGGGGGAGGGRGGGGGSIANNITINTTAASSSVLSASLAAAAAAQSLAIMRR